MDHDEPPEDWPAAEYEEPTPEDLTGGSDPTDPTGPEPDSPIDDTDSFDNTELTPEPVDGFDDDTDQADLVDDSGDTGDFVDDQYAEDVADDLYPEDGQTDEVVTDDADLDDTSAEVDEPVPGTDPDLDPLGDDASWQESLFPPALDVQAPEPVDGFPWSDPLLLGDDTAEPDPGYQPPDDTATAPPVADLLAYDGQETTDSPQALTDLAASEDPAISSLARFWSQD